MTATVLPLKEALTNESSTPEGSKKKIWNNVLSAALWKLFKTQKKPGWSAGVSSQSQNIILEDPKKQEEQLERLLL